MFPTYTAPTYTSLGFSGYGYGYFPQPILKQLPAYPGIGWYGYGGLLYGSSVGGRLFTPSDEECTVIYRKNPRTPDPVIPGHFEPGDFGEPLPPGMPHALGPQLTTLLQTPEATIPRIVQLKVYRSHMEEHPGSDTATWGPIHHGFCVVQTSSGQWWSIDFGPGTVIQGPATEQEVTSFVRGYARAAPVLAPAALWMGDAVYNVSNANMSIADLLRALAPDMHRHYGVLSNFQPLGWGSKHTCQTFAKQVMRALKIGEMRIPFVLAPAPEWTMRASGGLVANPAALPLV